VGGQGPGDLFAEWLPSGEENREKRARIVATVARQALFKVKMSRDEMRRLDRLAAERRQSRSVLVRDLIATALLGSTAGLCAELDALAELPDPLRAFFEDSA
jgi:hypothetical protein